MSEWRPSPLHTEEAELAGTTFALRTFARLTGFAMKSDWQIFGRTLVCGRDPSEIALTYDDGPNDRSTMDLLAVLQRSGVRATFFMLGNFVRQRPDIVRAVQAEGHLIGNHTMTHPSLADKTLATVQKEVEGCTHLLEDVLGAPVRYFRAPYGARRPAMLRRIRDLGLTPVQWNVHGRDWDPIGVGGILGEIDRRTAPVRRKGRGVNLLLHDGFDQRQGFDRTDTVRATEILIARARREGRRFVTVDAWD